MSFVAMTVNASSQASYNGYVGNYYNSATGSSGDPPSWITYTDANSNGIWINGSSGGLQQTIPWMTPAPLGPPVISVLPQIVLPDPRVDEMEKKIKELELKLAKLLPGELEAIEEPKSEGKRIVEL